MITNEIDGWTIFISQISKELWQYVADDNKGIKHKSTVKAKTKEIAISKILKEIGVKNDKR